MDSIGSIITASLRALATNLPHQWPDPSRRHNGVSALGADIRHYLSGEPVEHPDVPDYFSELEGDHYTVPPDQHH